MLCLILNWLLYICFYQGNIKMCLVARFTVNHRTASPNRSLLDDPAETNTVNAFHTSAASYGVLKKKKKPHYLAPPRSSLWKDVSSENSSFGEVSTPVFLFSHVSFCWTWTMFNLQSGSDYCCIFGVTDDSCWCLAGV